MMYLPYICKKCGHLFITMDKQDMCCPRCDSKDIVVDWEFFKEAIE